MTRPTRAATHSPAPRPDAAETWPAPVARGPVRGEVRLPGSKSLTNRHLVLAALAEQERLDAIRPDLDGTQIMALLDIPPGREVGQAYSFLLEQRMEQGPLGEERAAELLRAWWAARQE